ncbi:MAG: hypothetical protein K2P53_00160 [Rickettsiales bacterium]|nr:hypothetical protein [Rickettsiales bacterium]
MAPREIGELFLTIQSSNNILENYIINVEEICSHPRDVIIYGFSQFKEAEVFKLRVELFQEILERFNIEQFSLLNIILDAEDPVKKNLRKRYKILTCLDDIYLMSISLAENQLHKDFIKLISNSKQASQQMYQPSDINMALILKEVIDRLKALQLENKKIMADLHLLQVKYDELQKTNNEIVKNQCASQFNNTSNCEPHKSQENIKSIVSNSIKYHSPNQRNTLEEVTAHSSTEISSLYTDRKNKIRDSYATVVKMQNPEQNNRKPEKEKDCVTDYQEFKVVGKNNKVNKSHMDKQKKEPVFGNKVASNRSSIAGKRIIRESYIFVGGVCNSISEEDLSNYMNKEIGITPLDIKLNRENMYNRSFKVKINSTEKGMVLKPDVWDNNIIVKPFRMRREALTIEKPHQNTENHLPQFLHHSSAFMQQ